MTLSAPATPARPNDATTRTHAVLVTGAGGEMGHTLLSALADRHERGGPAVVALDLRELKPEERQRCHHCVAADVRSPEPFAALAERYAFVEVFHLAAVLSSGGERNPEAAHAVNVDGTVNVLRFAAEQGRRLGRRVSVLYPSTIAVYGMPDLATKDAAAPVREEQFCEPITMYGCNKLYGEHLGRYYSRHYQMLAAERREPSIDFRSIRFPGIISAETVPTGGTSDFGPEMLHAAAQRKAYACFVRPDSRIPFTTMPEAVEALLALAAADPRRLTRCVYNIESFSPSAEEIAAEVERAFPGSAITFAPDLRRQAIVDSWPAHLDDSAARRDFGWRPRHDLRSAFETYLAPRIAARYAGPGADGAPAPMSGPPCG
ncbi:MAG: NAD-dependent epimerase/dehydratase family protein [Phycisphaerales bacterium]